ncbi:MAG: hypothetical protein V1746_03805 [bacterium]
MKHPLEGQLILPNAYYFSATEFGGPSPWMDNASACQGYPVKPPFFWSGDGQDEGYVRYPSPIWPPYAVIDRSSKPDHYWYPIGYDLVGIKKIWYLLDRIRITGTYKRHGWKYFPFIPTPPPGQPQGEIREFTATWTLDQVFDIGATYYAANAQYHQPPRPMGQLRFTDSAYGGYFNPDTWQSDGYSFFVGGIPADDDEEEFISIALSIFVPLSSDGYDGKGSHSMLYQRSDGKFYPAIHFYIGSEYTTGDGWASDTETEEDSSDNEHTFWDTDYWTYDEISVPFLSGGSIHMRTWNKNGPEIQEGDEWWSELIGCQVAAEGYGDWGAGMVNQIGRPVW